MATVACSECGLPRGESEVGKPCPVCAAAPVATGTAPRTRKPAEPDPTDGLPADVSELYAPDAPTRPHAYNRTPAAGSRLALVGTVTFLLGALCGVGGVFVFQALDRPEPKPDDPEVAAKPNDDANARPLAPAIGDGSSPLAKPQAERVPAVAPMPHAPGIPPIVVAVDPDADPELKILPLPLPGRVTIHEFNEPCDLYSVPVMKKGEHVVLRGKGKIKTLRIHGLDAGSILDASELEVATVIVTGRIDGRSTLKLKVPNGAVNVSAKVDGHSIVQIDAPGGDVTFVSKKDMPKIDNGSTVAVTAKKVEFRGDITGADTRVAVTITRGGFLEIEAVRGQAVVEYKSLVGEGAPPTVRIGSVAATATVRKVE